VVTVADHADFGKLAQGKPPMMQAFTRSAVGSSPTWPEGPVERWLTPSPCPGWDVHDVVAHLVDTAKTDRLRFMRTMVAARLDFDRANEKPSQMRRDGTPFMAGACPPVTISTLALVMAMAGRPTYLDELDGPGRQILRKRISEAAQTRPRRSPSK
jgi:hypothetical protein